MGKKLWIVVTWKIGFHYRKKLSFISVSNTYHTVCYKSILQRYHSGRFSVTLIRVPGHSNMMGNARAGALLLESSSVDLGMPLTTTDHRAEIISRSQPILGQWRAVLHRYTWPSMDRKRQQLLGFGHNVMSTKVAMLTDHSDMGRHSKGCRSHLTASTWVKILWAKGYPLYLLMPISCEVIWLYNPCQLGEAIIHWFKDIASFVKLSGWFCIVG